METWMWIAIGAGPGVLVVLLIVGAIAMKAGSKRRKRLRNEFGPEYDRSVRTMGRRKAERDLTAAEERVADYELRPLDPEEGRRLSDEWSAVELQFIQSPGDAIYRADQFVADLMSRRGYPRGEFEDRARDLSVGHPRVTVDYHEARDAIESHKRGKATTEDLRRATTRSSPRTTTARPAPVRRSARRAASRSARRRAPPGS